MDFSLNLDPWICPHPEKMGVALYSCFPHGSSESDVFVDSLLSSLFFYFKLIRTYWSGPVQPKPLLEVILILYSGYGDVRRGDVTCFIIGDLFLFLSKNNLFNG